MKEENHTDSSQPRSVYERMIAVFFNFKPVEDLDEIIHDTFLGYGTAAHEFFRNREEVAGMARIQAEQLREQSFDLSRKPITEMLLANGSVCLIVEEMDLFMHAMEHRLALRLSTLLELKDGIWRVTHFHGSTPDSDIAEEEAFPMEGLRKKNEELEGKIRERTRELEIEAALERTRAQSMQMQHSGELSNVSKAFHQQLMLLGIDSEFSFVWLPDEAQNTHLFWTTWADGPAGSPTFHARTAAYPMDRSEPYTAACFADWASGVPVHEHFVPPADTVPFFAAWTELLEGAEGLTAEHFPEGIYYTEAFMKYGCFGIDIRRPLTGEEKTILHRFAREFERAYTRFLDLQKAEAQAQEAQIEAALERVRAQAMAMRHSDDLVQSTRIVFEELEKLHLSIERSGIGIFNAETKDCDLWTTVVGRDGKKELATGVTSLTVHPMLMATFEAWEAQQPLSYVLEGKELADYYERVSKSEFVLSKEVIGKSASLEREFYHYTPFGAGGLYFFSDTAPTEEDKKIMRRFAEVFDMTYTRFLDLQKAEAQAQEAQVEAALERIRAQVTGMQESAELLDIVVTMRAEFVKLGHEAHYFWHMRWQPETYEKAMTSGDGTRIGMVMKLPRHIHGDIPLLAEWEQSDHPTVVYTMDADAAIAYVDKMVALGDFQQIDPQAPSHDDIRHIGGLTFAMARTTHGEIGYSLPGEVPDPPAEDLETLVRFAGVFDLAYRRFEDLQKSELQKREAEIELALERVRSRTMAMQQSDELAEASHVLDQEVRGLGIETWGCAFHIYGENKSREWFSSEAGLMDAYPVPREKVFKRYYEVGQQGVKLYKESFEGETCRTHYEYLCTLPVLGDLLKGIIASGGSFPEKQYDHVAYFKYGHLLFITLNPVGPEAEKVFVRFAEVFEQTYTRFLDLQKAEAQAREARIEAALEKVRAHTMGMHQSGELREVIQVLYEQLVGLHLPVEHAGFILDYRQRDDMHIWFASQQVAPSEITIPYFDSPHWNSFVEARKKGEKFFANLLNFEAKNRFYEELFKWIPPLPEEAVQAIFSRPGLVISTVLLDNVGLYIENYSQTPFTDEENDLLMRFGKVFQQTYTRFLDLKKAEEQAWEARIEAALEKVRSRTMAMQHSDELPEAANVLFLEVQALGIPAWSCGYNILAPDQQTASCIMSSEGTLQHPFKLRLSGEASFDQWGDFIKAPETFFVQELGGKSIAQHYAFMKSFPDLEPIFAAIEEKGLSLPTHQINHLCKFTHGFLLFITYEPVPEAHDLFKRFTRVFEQTYTRFLDLKNMEARAREARIETALERVRARAMAMQQPEELKDVAQVLRHEMGLLGVEELETSSIYINDVEAQKAECWYAIKDLRQQEKVMVADHFALDLQDTWVGREMLRFYESAAEQVSILMKGKQRREWIDYCEAHSEPFRGYYGEVIPDRTYHLYKFSHGAIGVATDGDLSNESWRLLRRAASVFSLAYSRFRDLTQARLDLQRLKEEKKRAEEALAELQLTQKQLVHAEKMASLGELTAGIAHEIQNPLNFVNNFSEVSRELLEEMIAELKNGDAQEADAIARDVIQNLEKIVHHGKRADGIVKGMLQHSRSGDGQKQPTDLNRLAEEYLRLAYHGLRAKDKSFNAHMETSFDPKLPKAHVVPQDIGRVLLNLVTNAFHAVGERKASAPKGFEPTVWVTTRKTPGGVEISVRDNGGGIPENIREKIFQPFFTTKPTGQGTGLGLSMSYDIVTKGHSGQLKVASKVQEGTEFIVTLPV